MLAALIATRDRPALLADRALPSVTRQIRSPDILIVVDDSGPEHRAANRATVESCGTPAVYIENARTPGASGAWNTGLAWLHAHVPDPEGAFVAILDDDDCWEELHLEICLEAALQRDIDLVITGIIRHDAEAPSGRPQEIPRGLDEGTLLTGNPHVQGSNIFVRLRVLLEAGLFDESLPSTTDRDLCLRLLDLGDVRVGTVDAHTVHHHAEQSRRRLSSARIPEKLAGLDGFWQKYQGRMDEEQRRAALARGMRLFGWQPQPPTAPVPNHASEGRVEVLADPDMSCALVVGVIVDPDRLPAATRLLDDLLGLPEYGFAGVDVVLLENGPRPPDCERVLHAIVERKRREGLRCYLIDLERQREDARSGAFGGPLDRGLGRAGIAMCRTMIQHYVHIIARRRPGSIAWILDDDKRLDTGGGAPLARVLLRLRAAGVHIVLGRDVDCPPLPAASLVRTQLVDLLHNLRWLGKLDPAAPLPDRSAENVERTRLPDCYYDLARSTAHLEAPVWLVPARHGETAAEALARLADQVPRILAGEQVFRPLCVADVADATLAATPSVHRGGSTFVLDLEALRIPNPSVDLGCGELRRSDMVWAVLNRAHDRTLVEAPLWVRHDRAHLLAATLDLAQLARDVQGHALYSAIADVLPRAGDRATGVITLNEEQIPRAVARFRHHLQERVRTLDLSAYRVRGLRRAILRALAASDAGRRYDRPFWQETAGGRASAERIAATVESIAEAFRSEEVEALRRRVLSFHEGALRDCLRELGRRLDPGDEAGLAIWRYLEVQRTEIARTQIERITKVSGLTLLGSGSEGVVFTDGLHVYKSFDHWKSRLSAAQREFLRNLPGRWPRARGLIPLLRLDEEGQHAVLVYPFEPSTPYRGGQGRALIELLRECREHGIICRNIHPKNLRSTSQGVRLIDYGADIRPFTEHDFESMCRRAWLSYRWHHRPDLDDLLRAALSRDDLPELDGHASFRRAVEATHQGEVLDRLLLDICLGLAPRSVLDHGCGKAWLARHLASAEREVVGYDPDPAAQASWPRTPPPRLRLLGDPDALQACAPFDLVVSSLVLCTLDDPTYRRALQDLRALVDEAGHVVVAVCNPFFTKGHPTPLQDRELPAGADEEESFAWHKVVASSGRCRVDVHRPWSQLRRDIRRAGFKIHAARMTGTVDLDRFEPASDFLVLLLRPAPVGGPKTSLLIRTCAMEWQTIEEQVRHIVGQLEQPRAFCERLVVVDTRTGGFTRQYAPANVRAHQAALARLVRVGWLDRVVQLPEGPEEITSLHERWFGIAAHLAHTPLGAPVAATVFGIEACRGDHVLMVDADLLIGRLDPSHDYLRDMQEVLDSDPAALTVALNTCQAEDRRYTASGPRGPFRVEARGALVHRARLLGALPLPNERAGDRLLLSWHRSMDRLVEMGRARSYRGGDRRTFFIHPPNERKAHTDEWMAVLDRVEAGFIPAEQVGSVEIVAAMERWLGPSRREPFVFVVTGRDVPPGRLLRCLHSLRRQRGDWGAVVIDDGSRPARRDFVAMALQDLVHRVTLLRLRQRRGQLANLIWAIRHVCADPATVIITLDADDALIGDGVVERIEQEYARGADVTIGSMLRTDKHRAYPVDLRDPRGSRGGNVWQHLRTFRKRLFDAIPDSELRLDGAYVDLANDWAYMIPIVERAELPVHVPDPLYLHEPSGAGKRAGREAREAVIARLLARPPARKGGP